MNGQANPAQILLIEPQFVLRRTIATLARDFGAGTVKEASSLEAAAHLLAAARFDGVVMDVPAGAAPGELLTRLRSARFVSAARIPVVGMTVEPLGSVEPRMQAFGLVKLLSKPFKVGELLEVMRRMTR